MKFSIRQPKVVGDFIPAYIRETPDAAQLIPQPPGWGITEGSPGCSAGLCEVNPTFHCLVDFNLTH